MLDLLLKRYSNIGYVMEMDSEDGLKLIIKAIENEAKDKLYLQWLHDDARYDKSFIESSIQEIYRRRKAKNIGRIWR